MCSMKRKMSALPVRARNCCPLEKEKEKKEKVYNPNTNIFSLQKEQSLFVFYHSVYYIIFSLVSNKKIPSLPSG